MNLEKLEVEQVLENFGKYLVTESRKNLTRSGRRDTDGLYNSLDYDLNVTDNSIQFGFGTNNPKTFEYMQFIDKGVKGVGGVRKSTSPFNSRNNKGKLWRQNAKNSPFSFKKGNKPSAKHFKQWAQKRGLSEYAVREVVYHQGIKPTYFFSRPFELAYEKLPEEIIEAYGLDLDKFINITLNENANI